MKIAQILTAAVVGALYLSFAAGAHAQNIPGYVTVAAIHGQARYSTDGVNFHPLVVGQTLGVGAVIQTAANSKVDLVLGRRIATHINSTADHAAFAPGADSKVVGLVAYRAVAEQNVIRMFPNTVLAVDKLLIGDTGVDAMSDTELDLRQGRIFGSVKKLSAASEFLIKFPNGVAGVRGTTFDISADGSVTVADGSVVVSITTSSGTQTVTLNAGDQFNPATGTVSHLSGSELTQVEANAKTITSQISTVVQDIYQYAHDVTTVYVSPVR